MNTQSKLAAVMVLAGEAHDHLSTDKERLNWLSSLMRAIQADVKLNRGAESEALASIGQYLADEGSASVENFLDHFDARLTKLG
jgi:hypothetical protein